MKDDESLKHAVYLYNIIVRFGKKVTHEKLFLRHIARREISWLHMRKRLEKDDSPFWKPLEIVLLTRLNKRVTGNDFYSLKKMSTKASSLHLYFKDKYAFCFV